MADKTTPGALTAASAIIIALFKTGQVDGKFDPNLIAQVIDLHSGLPALLSEVSRLRDTVAERDAEIDTLRAMIAEEDK